uniref:microtubule-associated protein futsch-like n=1 Tax=Myxine glutinosa TaxID=7769 RepID=UPI00358E6597
MSQHVYESAVVEEPRCFESNISQRFAGPAKKHKRKHQTGTVEVDRPRITHQTDFCDLQLIDGGAGEVAVGAGCRAVPTEEGAGKDGPTGKCAVGAGVDKEVAFRIQTPLSPAPKRPTFLNLFPHTPLTQDCLNNNPTRRSAVAFTQSRAPVQAASDRTAGSGKKVPDAAITEEKEALLAKACVGTSEDGEERDQLSQLLPRHKSGGNGEVQEVVDLGVTGRNGVRSPGPSRMSLSSDTDATVGTVGTDLETDNGAGDSLRNTDPDASEVQREDNEVASCEIKRRDRIAETLPKVEKCDKIMDVCKTRTKGDKIAKTSRKVGKGSKLAESCEQRGRDKREGRREPSGREKTVGRQDGDKTVDVYEKQRAGNTTEILQKKVRPEKAFPSFDGKRKDKEQNKKEQTKRKDKIVNGHGAADDVIEIREGAQTKDDSSRTLQKMDDVCAAKRMDRVANIKENRGRKHIECRLPIKDRDKTSDMQEQNKEHQHGREVDEECSRCKEADLEALFEREGKQGLQKQEDKTDNWQDRKQSVGGPDKPDKIDFNSIETISDSSTLQDPDNCQTFPGPLRLLRPEEICRGYVGTYDVQQVSNVDGDTNSSEVCNKDTDAELDLPLVSSQHDQPNAIARSDPFVLDGTFYPPSTIERVSMEDSAALAYDSVKYTLVVDENDQLELVGGGLHIRQMALTPDLTALSFEAVTDWLLSPHNMLDLDLGDPKNESDEVFNTEVYDQPSLDQEFFYCRSPFNPAVGEEYEEVTEQSSRSGGADDVGESSFSRKFFSVFMSGSFGIFSCVLDGEWKEQTHRAAQRFQPRHIDELSLDADDPVYVVSRGSDGWYEGFNMRTRQRGVFPHLYVRRIRHRTRQCGKSSEGTWLESFPLRFLGSVEVPYHQGNEVLISAMRKVTSVHFSSAREAIRCMLEVSARGVRLSGRGSRKDRRKTHSQGVTFSHYFLLKDVAFCGCYPQHSRCFGFITKHPVDARYACHVLLATQPANRIATCFRRAFKKLYSQVAELTCPAQDIFME